MTVAHSAPLIALKAALIIGVAGIAAGCSSISKQQFGYQPQNVLTYGTAPNPVREEAVEQGAQQSTRDFSSVPDGAIANGVTEQADAAAGFDEINDPLEPLSRVSHNFNRGLDRVLLRPIAKVYGAVVPDPAKKVVHNFVTHWDLPSDAVSYAIQGDEEQTKRTVGRFLVNTVAGVGGLFDVASTSADLEHQPTDMGVALAAVGMDEGAYFEAPVLGPSTTRRSIGRLFERALNPISYVGLIDGSDFVEIAETSFTRYEVIAQSTGVVSLLDTRSQNDDLIEATLYSSPDTYSTLRSVYVQRRRAKIAGVSMADDAELEGMNIGTGLDDDPLYLPVIE